MIKPVRDVCILQDDALDIHVSDQVERLEMLIDSEDDGDSFFERTFITAGMDVLLKEATARLAGKSSQAIFHLKQAMGGGKTHLLVGLGLLAKNPQLRSRVCPDMKYQDEFGSAVLAAFNGRNSPEHYFWGEVADQLGKGDLFKRFWEMGPSAPGASDWKAIFDNEQSYLILLDELPPYFADLNTRQIGNGTVADIATRALANLLTAASEMPRVCVVVSDLSAAYRTGSALVIQALDDAKQELGRQERTITPVDMSGNEIYEILRKKLFVRLPSQEVIDEIATSYAKVLEEGTRSKVLERGAEAIADEISHTYPFHPQLKYLIALFKENEQFRQTRGLLELVSRLLQSVWNRPSNDVFLIGAQHFDFSIHEVRDKLGQIAGMSEIIAHDIWSVNGDGCAQVIDSDRDTDSATQVASLLLTASLSTTVSSVKGLTRQEILGCLVDPLRDQASFLPILEALEGSTWYLHKTSGLKIYFDRQENLTKMLSGLAGSAPQNQVDKLVKDKLAQMFEPKTKVAYQEVLPLPALSDVSATIRQKRVLLVVNPDSKLPPEAIRRYFDTLPEKNNILVLTGEKSQMATVEGAARKVFAVGQADNRIPTTHAQRPELDEKKLEFDRDFTTTILNLFDQVFFPIEVRRNPELRRKSLDSTWDQSKPYDGEAQIIATLARDPAKLHRDVAKSFGELREKAEELLWLNNDDRSQRSDITARYASKAGMPWMPPHGLSDLITMALSEGLWEDLGDGRISKRPEKKKTSCQLTTMSEPDDSGRVRLRVTPQNAGPQPIIYYQEGGEATQSSPRLHDEHLETSALRISFLVVDPTSRYETGPKTNWTGKLKIRTELMDQGGPRRVRLLVAPTASVIRYSTDGTEPRDGTDNTDTEPIVIGEKAARILVFASQDGVEAKEDFSFSAKGDTSLRIAEDRPARYISAGTKKNLDSRAAVFAALSEAREKQMVFRDIELAMGDTSLLTIYNTDVGATFLEDILKLLETLPDAEPGLEVTLKFKEMHFRTGHDLKVFMESHSFPVRQEEVRQ